MGGWHATTDLHCITVCTAYPYHPYWCHPLSFSRCFIICSFHMQSTNCTAYIAPEVGMFILVNTLFPLLPCYCVSPHKTGAAQSIFPVVCPLKSQPQKDCSVVQLPSTLTYICLQSPSGSDASQALPSYNRFSFDFHLCRFGAFRSIQWICYKGCLLPLVCTLSQFPWWLCGKKTLWYLMPSFSTTQVARCTTTFSIT